MSERERMRLWHKQLTNPGTPVGDLVREARQTERFLSFWFSLVVCVVSAAAGFLIGLSWG